MLEKIPPGLGRALKGVRAGLEKIAYNDPAAAEVPESLVLESPAWADGEALPAECTADGPGRSPPLRWRAEGGWREASVLLLVVEDADAPAPQPIVHLIVPDLGPRDGEIAAGALLSPADPDGLAPGVNASLGKNSYGKAQWLPPDPPRGHGPHRYCFQLFALSGWPGWPETPSRADIPKALAGRTVAKGMLIGTYERP